MNFNPKQSAAFIDKIRRIQSGVFTESDVELLLISIREYVGKRSLTKELGHFVAHPERNQGYFFEEINWRAAIIKFGLVKDGKSVVELGQTPKGVYDVIFRTGIAKINNKVWLEKLNMNQKDLTELVEKAYRFDQAKKVYILVDFSQISTISSIVDIALGTLGAIPITSIEAIVTDFDREVTALCKKLMPNFAYAKAIANQSDTVGLCLLSLMQGMTFALFDGTTGTLSFADHGFVSGSIAVPVYDEYIHLNGILSDVGTKRLNVSTSIISSSLPWSSYVDQIGLAQAKSIRSAQNGTAHITWAARPDAGGNFKLYPSDSQ